MHNAAKMLQYPIGRLVWQINHFTADFADRKMKDRKMKDRKMCCRAIFLSGNEMSQRTSGDICGFYWIGCDAATLRSWASSASVRSNRPRKVRSAPARDRLDDAGLTERHGIGITYAPTKYDNHFPTQYNPRLVRRKICPSENAGVELLLSPSVFSAINSNFSAFGLKMVVVPFCPVTNSWPST